MKAIPILGPNRRFTKKGNLIYVAVWSVQKNKNYPEGIKYSLTLINKGKRVIGYDYNPAEGHHKHFIKNGKLIKENYKFKNMDEIIIKFKNDVMEYEKEM